MVDIFRSVSLQELQTTLYGGIIFSDEGDGIQNFVYLKKRVMHYHYDKLKLSIVNKNLKHNLSLINVEMLKSSWEASI